MRHTISKILIATDKFRPKLTAKQACHILSSQLSKKYTTKSIPLADGGEGSIETIADIIDSETQTITAFDPLFRNIECSYLIEKKSQREKRRAFIEMSRVSGLRLLKKEERNPMKTSTYGTGQMIKDAVSKGCDQIVLFIGGSATNDGGIGAAAALGYQFLDQNNNSLVSIGQNLAKIEKILVPQKDLLRNVSIQIASDVENPLLGPNGATFTYGPQKGTKPTDLQFLEQGLTNLNNKYVKHFQKDFSAIKGAGAAGGLGYGSVAFLNAKITSGIKFITQITQLEQQIKNSDIIITGEGKLDNQTLQGKTVHGVLKLAEKYHKPVVVFCGKSELQASSLGSNVTIIENQESGMKMEYAIQHAEQLLRQRVKKHFQL